jgi:hypothetical protein
VGCLIFPSLCHWFGGNTGSPHDVVAGGLENQVFQKNRHYDFENTAGDVRSTGARDSENILICSSANLKPLPKEHGIKLRNGQHCFNDKLTCILFHLQGKSS